jgi:hypothetical protein
MTQKTAQAMNRILGWIFLCVFGVVCFCVFVFGGCCVSERGGGLYRQKNADARTLTQRERERELTAHDTAVGAEPLPTAILQRDRGR